MSGLGSRAIEKRIRENQYEKYQLKAPAQETVRDYFRLRISVAYETSQKISSSPWLFAAELEFPGCSRAFFHPIFDLLFGWPESAAFWRDHFSRIPDQWIQWAERHCSPDLVTDFRAINSRIKQRRHRRYVPPNVSQLRFVHICLLHLPEQVRGHLFERNGLASGWARTYKSAKIETRKMKSFKDLDGLAGLLGLAKEAAEIGDRERFSQAKKSLIEHLAVLDQNALYSKIASKLKQHVLEDLSQLSTHRYHMAEVYGAGYPVGWRIYLANYSLEQHALKMVNK
jgi:hypothetical protein